MTVVFVGCILPFGSTSLQIIHCGSGASEPVQQNPNFKKIMIILINLIVGLSESAHHNPLGIQTLIAVTVSLLTLWKLLVYIK